MEVHPVSLREALGAVSFVGVGDVTAIRVCADSRLVQPGDLFVALPGIEHDGHAFVHEAVSRGASALLCQRPFASLPVPQCVVRDSRAAWSKVCLAQYGNPQKSLSIAGVTGTNGKTSTAWILRSILETAGYAVGMLGTIEYSDGINRIPSDLTTPDPPKLAEQLARMRRHRATHCVMEISSHALDQHRCAGLELSTAAITNITRDHFDYHGGPMAYRATKSKIAHLLRRTTDHGRDGRPVERFGSSESNALCIGIDDEGCRAVLSSLPAETEARTFGFSGDAQLRAEVLQREAWNQHVTLKLVDSTLSYRTSLSGRHNVLNQLAAAAMAESLGVCAKAIQAGIERVASIPGRMERIDEGQDFAVLVDYAHTPDGIAQCLTTARSLGRGMVILVFGAGGDRDREKRPLMAQAAADGADRMFVTSDNPRRESPAAIINQICAGFSAEDRSRVETCPDRSVAIRRALEMASPGDVVVIAGRGHETLQQIGDRAICFDDRKVARRALRELQHLRTPSNLPYSDAVPA